jgi:hypothetical protein
MFNLMFNLKFNCELEWAAIGKNRMNPLLDFHPIDWGHGKAGARFAHTRVGQGGRGGRGGRFGVEQKMF